MPMQEERRQADSERRQTDQDLSRRMDTQDKLLREIRDMVVAHLAEDKTQTKIDEPAAKALDEIVLMWRASKILIPTLVIIATTVWAAYSWAKDHIK